MDIIVINTIYLTITDIVIKLNAIPFFGGATNKFDRDRNKIKNKYRDRNKIKTLVFPDIF